MLKTLKRLKSLQNVSKLLYFKCNRGLM